MKMRLMMVILSVLLLSVCSSFRETGISDDGEIRQIMTEHSEEIELHSEPKRFIQFRWICAVKAELLGGDTRAVSAVVEDSLYARMLTGGDASYLEHGDLEAMKSLNPDLIVTDTPDEYLFDYQKVAAIVP